MFSRALPVFLKFEDPELIVRTDEIESIRPATWSDNGVPRDAHAKDYTIVRLKSGRTYAVKFTLDEWTEALSS